MKTSVRFQAVGVAIENTLQVRLLRMQEEERSCWFDVWALPRLVNILLASQLAIPSEHHHEQYTRTSCWICSGSHNHAPVDKTRKALCTLTFPCRIFLSLQRRRVSDRASADGPRRVLQLLLLVLRQRTLGTDLPHAFPMLYIEKKEAL